MFFLQYLSERLRFLVYALGVIFFPFLILFSLNIFPTFKQNLENWAEKIFSQYDSYTYWQVDGPVNQKGVIRFKKDISLHEVVKRVGGVKFGYRIPLKIQHKTIDLLPRDNTPDILSVSLDLTDFLEKTPPKYQRRNFKTQFKKKYQYARTNNVYHGKIKQSFVNKRGKLGERNERRSRYR